MSKDQRTTSPSSGDGATPAVCTTAQCRPTPTENDDGSINYGDNIRVEGAEEFKQQTIADLNALYATDSGRAIIDSINTGTHTTTIVETNRGNACAYESGADRFVAADGTPGAGTNSTVHYNPDRIQIGDGSEDWMTRPPAVGLGHELVHAQQASYGQQISGQTDGTNNRELQAVGLPPYDGGNMHENGIREDLGEPPRPRY